MQRLRKKMNKKNLVCRLTFFFFFYFHNFRRCYFVPLCALACCRFTNRFNRSSVSYDVIDERLTVWCNQKPFGYERWNWRWSSNIKFAKTLCVYLLPIQKIRKKWNKRQKAWSFVVFFSKKATLIDFNVWLWAMFVQWTANGILQYVLKTF